MMENRLASGTLAESEAKDVQSRLPQLKSELDAQTTDLQNRQAAEAEASSQFRSEQAKLTELQDRIDRLDKALEKLPGVSPKQ
jgi:chromosome segregation ATPase